MSNLIAIETALGLDGVASHSIGLGLVSIDSGTSKFSTRLYNPIFDNGTQAEILTLTDMYYTVVIGPKLQNSVVLHSKSMSLVWMQKDSGVGTNLLIQKQEYNSITGYSSIPVSSTTFPIDTRPLYLADVEATDYMITFDISSTSNSNTIRFINVGGTGVAPTLGVEISLTPGVKISNIYDFKSFKFQGQNHIYYNGYVVSNTFNAYFFELNTGGSVVLKAAWTQPKYMLTLGEIDNLNNQDYIYTMLASALSPTFTDVYLGAFKISDFFAAQAGNGIQTGDIFSSFGSKTNIQSSMTSYRLMNTGPLQYILGIPGQKSSVVKMFPKDYRNFGKTEISVILPTGSPQTSATYAYGFFRTSLSDPFALYYQQISGTDPIAKALFAICPPSTPYFDTASHSCISTTEAQSLIGYWRDDAHFEVTPCSSAGCNSCPASAATCTNCKAGFSLKDGACLACGLRNCLQCSSGNVCGLCSEPYTGPACLGCLSGYLKNSLSGECVACSISGCLQCSAANVCSSCADGKVPTASGKQCLQPAASCSPLIPQCQTCASSTKCSTCNQDYHLSDDRASCPADRCDIDNCKECDSENHCAACVGGLVLSADGKSCNVYASAPTDQTYADFDPETQTALVQVDRPASDYDFSTFSYALVDTLTKKIYTCPGCSAQLVADFSKALRFIVVSEVELLSATLQCSYPLSSLKKKGSRGLQTTDQYGVFEVENIRVPGSTSTNNDKIAYQAFTTINAIRFFATIFLGIFNSAHAFWSTYQYSWMQLWALLPGKFVSYPDRFLNWHYKWYLLVIDFGDPFKSWKDWHLDGAKCFAQTEYPTSRLGCGFVDNFGQNFVIIFCILAFCLLISSVLVIDWWRRRRNLSGRAIDSPHPQGQRRFFRSTTQIEQAMPKLLAQVYIGLGLPYFFRFMDAIQPSLIFFSMLQYSTYVSSTNIGVSVFFSVCFFVYYLATLVVAVLLARKVWIHLQEHEEEEVVDLGRVARKVGGWLRSFSFYFNGLKRVDAFWRLLYPVIEYFRILLICVFMIALRHRAKTALGLVLMIEAARLVFIVLLHRNRVSVLYAVQDYVITGFFLLYLVIKLASNDNYSETTIQQGFGWTMAFFLGIIWTFILLDVLIDAFVLIRQILLSRRQKEESAKSSQSKEIKVLELLMDKDIPEMDGDQQSPVPIAKQISLSSDRKAEFDSQEMNEGSKEDIEAAEQFRAAPLSEFKKANYESREMNDNFFRVQEVDTQLKPAEYSTYRQADIDFREMRHGYKSSNQLEIIKEQPESAPNAQANYEYGVANDNSYRVQEVDLQTRPAEASTYRLANLDSRDIIEGYASSNKVESKSYYEANTNRRADFDSKDMSEGYQSDQIIPGHRFVEIIQTNRNANVEFDKLERNSHKVPFYPTTQYVFYNVQTDDQALIRGPFMPGADGYLSKDMNEKPGIKNVTNENVLETNPSKAASLTYEASQKRMVLKGLIKKEPIRRIPSKNYQVPSISERIEDAYDSRDMEEDW